MLCVESLKENWIGKLERSGVLLANNSGDERVAVSVIAIIRKKLFSEIIRDFERLREVDSSASYASVNM